MKKKIFFIFLFLNVINISYCLSSINNSIIGKVGKEIITQYDLENEIKTILFLGRQNLNQENSKTGRQRVFLSKCRQQYYPCKM